MNDFLAALRAQRILPILRGTDPDVLVAVADAVVAGGLRILELTMTSPDALGDVRRVRERQPDAVVGVGTVTTPAQVGPLLAAGVEFVVTPVSRPAIVAACSAGQVPVIAGALTPTEVLVAHEAGATAVKVFPAGRLGAPYLADLRSVLPGVPLVPTGGIGHDEVAAYLERGAVAVGLGSSLFGAALRGDADAIAGLTDRVAATAGQASTADPDRPAVG